MLLIKALKTTKMNTLFPRGSIPRAKIQSAFLLYFHTPLKWKLYYGQSHKQTAVRK